MEMQRNKIINERRIEVKNKPKEDDVVIEWIGNQKSVQQEKKFNINNNAYQQKKNQPIFDQKAEE